MKKQTRLSKFKYEISCGFARFKEAREEIAEALGTVWWGIKTILHAFKFEKPKDYGPPMSDEDYEALRKRCADNWERHFDKVIFNAIKHNFVK
jgi:hypothetical protein